jgi:hypothetical protein
MIQIRTFEGKYAYASGYSCQNFFLFKETFLCYWYFRFLWGENVNVGLLVSDPQPVCRSNLMCHFMPSGVTQFFIRNYI